jgi:hypothetical protein
MVGLALLGSRGKAMTELFHASGFKDIGGVGFRTAPELRCKQVRTMYRKRTRRFPIIFIAPHIEHPA